MRDDRYPRMSLGSGPEANLPADFAARVIARAEATRAHRARVKIGLSAGGIALVLAATLFIRTPPQTSALNSSAALAAADFYTNASDSEDGALLAVMMPNAAQAERFDAYYRPSSWDAYASWDSASYDWSRTR